MVQPYQAGRVPLLLCKHDAHVNNKFPRTTWASLFIILTHWLCLLFVYTYWWLHKWLVTKSVPFLIVIKFMVIMLSIMIIPESILAHWIWLIWLVISGRSLAEGQVKGICCHRKIWPRCRMAWKVPVKAGRLKLLTMSAQSHWRKIRLSAHLGRGSCMITTSKQAWNVPSLSHG